MDYLEKWLISLIGFGILLTLIPLIEDRYLAFNIGIIAIVGCLGSVVCWVGQGRMRFIVNTKGEQKV